MRTYASGPLCVTGDAAHATTPWQASGAGMSLEDSAVLSTLLGRAETPAMARAALKAYSQVRRPRTQRIVESSRRIGQISIGEGEKVGFDWEKESFYSNWDFIFELDMDKHLREAIEIMEQDLDAR